MDHNTDSEELGLLAVNLWTAGSDDGRNHSTHRPRSQVVNLWEFFGTVK